MLRLVSSAARSEEEEAELLVGKGKGIQGKNNSCYVDVSLMMLFAFRKQFDVLLTLPTSTPNCSRAAPSSSGNSVASTGRVTPSSLAPNVISSDEVHFFQHFITSMVVNPLRRSGFVPYAHIMTLRSMMSQLYRQESDNFVQEAQTDDVNVFLERMQQILCGGSGAGVPGTPLAEAARSLLDISVATAPVVATGSGINKPMTSNRKEESRSVVTVAEILAANGLFPKDASKPFFLNIPRSDNGLLPYHMIVPTLYLHPPRNVEDQQQHNEPSLQSPAGAPFLELTAIITFETSIQHYRGIFKRSCGSWVEYDSMGEVQETEQGGLEHLAVTVPASMQIFEDLERDPVLRALCCDYLFPDDSFYDFMFDQVQSSPQRKGYAKPGPMDDVSKAWSIFRQAARRPYLYMYSPRIAAANTDADVGSTTGRGSILEKVPINASLASRLLQRLVTLRSWTIALGVWEQEDALPLVPKPPPPVHGCPDCGTFFETEKQFITHMQSQLCVAQQQGLQQRDPPQRPAVAAKECNKTPPRSSAQPLPSHQHQEYVPFASSSSYGNHPARVVAPLPHASLDADPLGCRRDPREAPLPHHPHHHHRNRHPKVAEGVSLASLATIPAAAWRCEHCDQWLPIEVRQSHIAMCDKFRIHPPPRR